MCSPEAVALLSGIQPGVEVGQQQQAADYQNKYEELAYGQRKAAALETFVQLREREYQERVKAASDIQRITLQARHALATAKLTALEGGAGGQSVGLLLDNFQRGELANIGVVQQNLDFTTNQIRAEERAAGRIQAPSRAYGPLDTPLGIIATGLNIANTGFTAYQGAKPPTPNAN